MSNDEPAIECGIVVLPIEMPNFARQFISDAIPNVPHLSFYQANFCIKDIPMIKEKLLNIKLPDPFELTMRNEFTVIEGDLFWEVNENDVPVCCELSDTVIARIAAMRSKKPFSQIKFDSLNEEQQKLVEAYGIYWIKQLYLPHITLSYKISVDGRNVNYLIESSAIRFQAHLRLARLGSLGNILEFI